MAEAGNSQRFFCHSCTHEVTPDLPDFTCPDCNGGFIEEISQNEHEHSEESSTNDPASQFAEIMQRAFMDSLHMRPSQNSSRNTDGQMDTNRLQEDGQQPQTSTGPAFRIQHIHHRNHHHPLEMALQDLITNITRGALGGHPIMISSNMHGSNVHGNPADYAWGPGGLDAIITQLMNQLEGTGPPPAKPEEIQALKTVHISKAEVDQGLQCSVCMEDFKIDEIVKRLPCNHQYHPACIEPWLELHGTCPVCRKTLSGEDTSTAQIPTSAQFAESSTSPRNQQENNASSQQNNHLPRYHDDNQYD